MIGSPPHTRERLSRFNAGEDKLRITPAYAGKTPKQRKDKALIRDHPRIRGKDLTYCLRDAIMIGSPPHTRERLSRFNAGEDKLRITPAYAGKTPKQRKDKALIRDHPRIRGKDFSSDSSGTCNSGSPPHTRERLHYKKLAGANKRITPAYAGKTMALVPYQSYKKDHPRIRGKDIV